MLKVKFIGATDGVTGSCSWLHHEPSNSQYLVDCGLYQEADKEMYNTQIFEFDPHKIKAVFLTHAHLDHCGLLPKLIQEGFAGLVYATRATRALTVEMLRDSAKISGLYSKQDIEQIHWHEVDHLSKKDYQWMRTLVLADGLRVFFNRSSHILGATAVTVQWDVGDASQRDWRQLVFSGDVGPQQEEKEYLPLLKAGHEPPPNANYLVVESTYGARVRDSEFKSYEKRLTSLQKTLTKTLQEKQGKVLLPAFSLQRIQEVLIDLIALAQQGRLPRAKGGQKLRIVFHAPLAIRLNKIFAEHLFDMIPSKKNKYKYLNKHLAQHLQMPLEAIKAMFQKIAKRQQLTWKHCELRFVEMGNVGRIQKENDIILTSSGMCDAGPVTEYLQRMEKQPRNTMILTGYQAPNTKSAELGARKMTPQDFVQKNANPVTQQADVVDLSGYYSAHADSPQLLEYMFNLRGYPRQENMKVFINHGNPKEKIELIDKIRERAAEQRPEDRRIVEVRKADHRWFDLTLGDYVDSSLEEIALKDREIENLKKELKRLQKGSKTAEGTPQPT